MDIPPLLKAATVLSVFEQLRTGSSAQQIKDAFPPSSVEEQIHVLRYLFIKEELTNSMEAMLLETWRLLLPATHELDGNVLREALWRQSEWWDAFRTLSASERDHFDQLETALEQIGHSASGPAYLNWVALHPPYNRLHDIWDEHRRGALTGLARYAYSRSTGSREVALLRHLDDVPNVQTDVVDICVAMKSRYFAKVAPWYVEHDADLRPMLDELL